MSSEYPALEHGPLADSRRPADVQILSLALSNWDEFDEDNDHSIRDLVYSTARQCGDELAKHDEGISRGLRRLEKFVRFKRA